MFDKDDKHNVSSQLHFVHSTLQRIQRVRARHVIEMARSPRFIFSCIFAIVLVIILLSLCFCPSLFVKIVKNIFESILQLATYVVERLVHLFTAFGSVLCLFYNERKNKSQTREIIEQELAAMDTRQPEVQEMTPHRNDFSPRSETTVLNMPDSSLETMLQNQQQIQPGFVYHPSAPHLRWSNSYDKLAMSQPPEIAQKAIRFVETPARPAKLGSRAETGAENPVIPFRLDTRTNSGAVARTAPSPTFGKTNANFPSYMPGTPKRLF